MPLPALTLPPEKDSTHLRILLDVQATLRSLPVPLYDIGSRVFCGITERSDSYSFPCVVLYPAAQGETQTEVDCGDIETRYPVEVRLMGRADTIEVEQLPYYLRWRQQVREAFPRYVPLTNVSGFRRIEFVGLPPFDSRDPKYLELHSVMQFVVAVVTPTP